MRYEDSFDTDPWVNTNDPMPDPVSNPPMRIAYEYDLLGRKVKETMTPGTGLEYATAYDHEGRIEIYESPQGDLLYEYDSVTGLKKAMTSYPAAKTPVQIRDDAAATPPYAASTTRTVYTYDDLGRLFTVQVTRRNGAAVNEDPTTYSYNKVGSQEKVIYPDTNLNGISNGNEAVYEYDGLNRLVRLTHYKDSGHVENQLLSRFEYSCNANGQRATAVETRTGWIWTGSGSSQNNSLYGYPQREMAYRYDGLGRLIYEKRSQNDPNSFVYDLVGNKVSQTIGNRVDGLNVHDNETTDYGYNDRDQLYQEVLHKDGLNYTITYGYDNNGSLTSQITFGDDEITDEAVGYGYDLRGRLKQVTTTPYTNGVPGTAVVTQYAYDPSGNRVRKQVGAGTPTDYLIDPSNPTGYAQVLQETTGSTVTSYILGADVIGQATGSTPIYLLYDGHGSVRNHANSSGNLMWFDIPGLTYDGTDDPTDQDYTLYSYDAWGQECRRPTGEGLYYSGEMFDPTLKMYNLRARWYNPANGRFNTIDPYVGNSYDPQSLHKYLYCHADPVNSVDLSGEMSLCETISVTAIIGFIGGLAAPGLHHAMEHINDSLSEIHQADAISFLEKGVDVQRQRDIREIRDPDEFGMTMQFYRDLGNNQKIVTYSTRQLEHRALWTIDSAIHGAQLANAGLVVGGAVAGSNFAQILWSKPHGIPEHWDMITAKAVADASKPNVQKVYTNAGINKLVGQPGNYKPNLRADVGTLTTSGKINITEVRSPTQSFTSMQQKGELYRQLLGAKLGEYKWVNIGDPLP